MKAYRVDRWMTMLGIASRTQAAIMIKRGLVESKDGLVEKSNIKINEAEELIVEGESYILKEFVYYMMNKPDGVLSASRDSRAQTVIDLLPDKLCRPGLFPAGRLDKDTEGFVLITNDGKFAHNVLSPKNRVPKTYIAKLNQRFDVDYLSAEFEKGVDIGEEGTTLPAKLEIIEDSQNPTVQIIICEGKFHQVKRMFLAFDLKVIKLRRTKIGQLRLDPSLATGESREITQQELEEIIINR